MDHTGPSSQHEAVVTKTGDDLMLGDELVGVNSSPPVDTSESWHDIVVPHGVAAGQQMCVITPGENEHVVEVPQGLAAGDVFRIQIVKGCVVQRLVQVPVDVYPRDSGCYVFTDQPSGMIWVPSNTHSCHWSTEIAPNTALMTEQKRSVDELQQLLISASGISSEKSTGPSSGTPGWQDTRILPDSCCCSLSSLAVKLRRCIRGEDEQQDEEKDEDSQREQIEAWLEENGFEERSIDDDGNCQFASASDQLYGTPHHHKSVRDVVINQLRCNCDDYKPYVHELPFDEYVSHMSKRCSWGDHVTLQALADAYGTKVMLVTAISRNSLVEVQPRELRSETTLWLCFSADHYSSLRLKSTTFTSSLWLEDTRTRSSLLRSPIFKLTAWIARCPWFAHFCAKDGRTVEIVA